MAIQKVALGMGRTDSALDMCMTGRPWPSAGMARRPTALPCLSHGMASRTHGTGLRINDRGANRGEKRPTRGAKGGLYTFGQMKRIE